MAVCRYQTAFDGPSPEISGDYAAESGVERPALAGSQIYSILLAPALARVQIGGIVAVGVALALHALLAQAA